MNQERFDLLTLAGLWCQKVPVDAAKLFKALAPLLSASSVDAVAESLDRLTARGEIERTQKKGAKGKPPQSEYAIAEIGSQRMRTQFGRPTPPKTFPSLVAGPLTAIALDMPIPMSDADVKSFKKALPLAICARPLGISLSAGADAAKGAILARALGRLFQPPAKLTIKKVPAGMPTVIAIGAELGVSPDKLAFKTVDQLINAVAMGTTGATKAGDLPAAVVRQWIAADGVASAAKPAFASVVNVDPAASAGGYSSASAPSAINPASFARNVLAAARDVVATNGRGVSNLRDQVLVASVCERFGELFGRVGLDEFKKHLRDVSGGEVMLVCEDRIPADRQQEFRESEVRIGASVFHYIRI